MTKKQMVRILKDEFGKTDSECKLGHRCAPYSQLVLKSQKSKGKRKFVKPPTNAMFENERKRLEKKQNGDKKKDKKQSNEIKEEDTDNLSDNDNNILDHGSCLEDVDDIEAFAGKVNEHAGRSVFSEEYVSRIKDEDLTLVDLEAMVVDWKKNGVLLLTNKAGDFMMKSGHVRAMYEYIEHINALAMAQAATVTAKVGGDSECGKGGGSGDIEEPFMGDADTSPDYVGMIKYLYEDKLKSMRILLLKKVYFAKRGVFWLRIIAMMREFFARQAKAASSNKNLKIYSTNLFKEVCGMKGGWDMTKWYAISILVSPTKTEEIFQEHKQALTGTNALNAVRNCLADVYAANKEDLGAVSYGFPENFVSDFQAMLGIDIWKAVKTHYETSAAYEDYAKEIEENE
eukprot:65006_1